MRGVFFEPLFDQFKDLVRPAWSSHPVLVCASGFVDLLSVGVLYCSGCDAAYSRSHGERADAAVCF